MPGGGEGLGIGIRIRDGGRGVSGGNQKDFRSSGAEGVEGGVPNTPG